ncbi:hypothetical protein RB596_007043 [Gaeumannomyces avenae]
MALQNAYLRFLAAPDPSALAENASLSYITTTTTVAGAAEVVKHLTDLRKHLNKTKEDILSSIEGRDGLGIALETETSLEFTVSGGPYLPGLDDNFVTDRGVHLVVTHFVAFDRAGKIVQIRQSWDQASLLKQLDVIGRSGRNWPIRDSKDQIKLITKCVGGSAAATEAADLASRSRGSSTNAMRDPHATLNLFAPRAEEPEPESIISPYAGKTRPRQRSFTEILGDEPEDDDGSGVSGDSPSKSVIAPKGGAGKNFQPMRLFDGAAEAQGPDSPEQRAPDRFYRPNPKKYDHFDFVDGSDPKDAPVKGTAFEDVANGKHKSQWAFEDFTTPSKPRPRPTWSQEERHWSTENSEVAETPVAQKPAPPKPRRDAAAHFELQDDGEPSGEPRPAGRPRGAGHNDGLGLYKNNLYSADGSAPPEDTDSRVLGNITNIKERRRDFNSKFEMTDDSPRQSEFGANVSRPPVPEDRKKAVKNMEANWSSYDKSPVSQKENSLPVARGVKKTDERGIVIGGDGSKCNISVTSGWLNSLFLLTIVILHHQWAVRRGPTETGSTARRPRRPRRRYSLAPLLARSKASPSSRATSGTFERRDACRSISP